jgi:quinol-cytochrome oxidoreductase complex cytochrome b subunit
MTAIALLWPRRTAKRGQEEEKVQSFHSATFVVVLFIYFLFIYYYVFFSFLFFFFLVRSDAIQIEANSPIFVTDYIGEGWYFVYTHRVINNSNSNTINCGCIHESTFDFVSDNFHIPLPARELIRFHSKSKQTGNIISFPLFFFFFFSFCSSVSHPLDSFIITERAAGGGYNSLGASSGSAYYSNMNLIGLSGGGEKGMLFF